MMLSLFAAALVASAAPVAGTPEHKWVQEIQSANEAWAGRRLAILKIDDAIYLKDGQSAFLMSTATGYRWSLAAPAGLVPSVRFEAGKALTQIPKQDGTIDILTQKDGALALDPRVDLKAQIAQIEPGQNGLRLAVYNQANPAPSAFKGVEYYPYRSDFRVSARFEPAAQIAAEDFQTSRGWWKRFYRVGDAVFSLDGREQRLPFYAGSDKAAEIKEMSAFFMDALTGTETYGVGRYIDVPVSGGLPTDLTIDFNFAYNPNCARSPHYNCPQAKVTLSAAIRAGEKKPGGH
jgi:uncharacterized protein (DUF1684 family)